MAITARMVKSLREKTGAGMMDCKKALSETDGNIESAVDWLRKKGLSAASKRAGRVAAEGKVVALAEEVSGVLIEINTETDFSAKNASFVAFAETVADLALKERAESLDLLKACSYPGTDHSVEAELKELIAAIGENMALRRYAALSVDQGVVATYVHMGGKIGAVVALESDAVDGGEIKKLSNLGKSIAMHVVAATPLYLNRDGVPEEVVERERAVLFDQVKDSGKPDAIVEKIVTGRLKKFYSEVCLVDQAYVIDPDKTVDQIVREEAKTLGKSIRVKNFHRFALGEGLEKRSTDFAKEVSEQLRQ